MRTKIGIAVGIMLAVVVVATGAVAAQGVDTRPSWENEDGTMDVSKLPATRFVVDRTGHTVGVISTDYMKTGNRNFPLPVTGPDGQLVGHIGPNGYWAVGEPESVLTDSVTTIEDVGDPDGGQ